MESDLQIRQLILVTDGESNVGPDPVVIAKKVHEKGITVSTIGIIDGKQEEKPLVEVHSIAENGGGICEVTDITGLSQTMEMVTQRSVYKTIERAISKELKSILGNTLDDIHPSDRKKITELIDKYGEESQLKCCIVLDCSASMTKKMSFAKNSVIQLLRVLKARKGRVELAVLVYPGNDDIYPTVICSFTEDFKELEMGLQKITIGGTTPTGLAIEWASNLLLDKINLKKKYVRQSKELEEEGILKSSII